jgi:hypothetical protein
MCCGGGSAPSAAAILHLAYRGYACATVDRQMDSYTCIRPWERISVSARDTDGRLAFDAHTDSIDTHQASQPHDIFYSHVLRLGPDPSTFPLLLHKAL